MTVRVVVHEEPDGGFWAEVPALPGCVTEGDTMDELMSNLKDAIEGVMAVRAEMVAESGSGKVMDIAV